MENLLCVDDDKAILRIITRYFSPLGFSVFTASTSQEALELLKRQPIDCVILDIMLPGVDGFELCKAFKGMITAPIIFLTSLTEREIMYQGFSIGGDDFMTKPFDLHELELRVRARISQNRESALRPTVLDFSPLTLDLGSRLAAGWGKTLPLTAYEFDILLLLAQNPERLFSQEEIYRSVWKLPDLTNAQTVKVHVARLRHKLETAMPEQNYIGTVWKRGYQFLPKSKKEEAN
ncbi:MAG: response regulator transcription factor [Oscillospiraceae bacterium]